jgi:D-sedoheptulose 7-phosphate isomerase
MKSNTVNLKEVKEENFSTLFLAEAKEVIDLLDTDMIERAVQLLVEIKKNRGRLFILGVGGSAANASHAVNDFRKIVGIEAYAPTDNASELTARTNDEGWETVFSKWLEVSQLRQNDGILILSVGGGNREKNISSNLVAALEYAKQQNSTIIGIVSRDGGYTAQVADAAILVPVVNEANTTPHAEAFQAVIWHLMGSHPALKASQTKWESVAIA